MRAAGGRRIGRRRIAQCVVKHGEQVMWNQGGVTRGDGQMRVQVRFSPMQAGIYAGSIVRLLESEERLVFVGTSKVAVTCPCSAPSRARWSCGPIRGCVSRRNATAGRFYPGSVSGAGAGAGARARARARRRQRGRVARRAGRQSRGAARAGPRGEGRRGPARCRARGGGRRQGGRGRRRRRR